MKSRPTSRKKSPAIDSRQRQLAEQENLLKKQMQDLQRQIEEAPKRQQEALKIKRDEIIHSYEKRRGMDFFSSLPDKRHHSLNASLVDVPRRRRKGEVKAAQIQFITLFVLLALAVFFAIRAIHW